MTFQHMKFEQGEEVIVLASNGEYECRGKIVGRSDSMQGHSYDVQPSRAETLAKRMCGLPESRLRRVPQQVKAYEAKKLEDPIIMMGDA